MIHPLLITLVRFIRGSLVLNRLMRRTRRTLRRIQSLCHDSPLTTEMAVTCVRLFPNRNANAIATIVLFMSESALPFLPDLLSLQSNPPRHSLYATFLRTQATFCNGTRKMTDPAQVHASALVIDTHADTPQRFLDEQWNFTDPLNGGMLNYDSAKEGNLDAQFFAIWVDPSQYPANASARRTLALIDATLEQVHRAPEQTPALHLSRRHPRRAQTRQIRRPHRNRRRPLHRKLPRSPPRLSPPRRPLHDPNLV